MKKFVGLTLKPELVEEIDRKRGLIPRSTFVEVLLEKSLEEERG